MAGLAPNDRPQVRLSRDQVRRVDTIAVEKFGVPSVVLMENASRQVADAAEAMLQKMILPRGGRIVIVCGGGNNGGDGFAAARHLHNRGHNVALLASKPVSELSGDAAINATIVTAMHLPIIEATPNALAALHADLLIDALIGTGLDKPLRQDAADLVEAMNEHEADVLAVDIPSGLDCDTGEALGDSPVVRAARTVTFVAEKVGFGGRFAKEHLGRVIVADIGCPEQAITEARRGL